MRRLTVKIHGTVQGVGFRQSAVNQAVQLGVKGWIRNLGDGSVEVVAEGERHTLDRLLQFLRVGPPGAKVSRVDIQWGEGNGSFSGFDVR